MPQYRYRARSADGKEVKGTLQAQSEDRAAALLRTHNLTLLEINEGESSSILNRNVFGGSVNTRDLILFSRQLSTMIRAGVPILQAIQALAKQVDKPVFIKLLENMAYDIEGGESLSVTMNKHPEVFSLFFLGVVRTGEASGRLADSLFTMADYIEQNYIFTRKVRSALMYPAFVLTVVFFVVILMFTFVVPQLVSLFDEAKVQLPLPTRILIGVNNFLQHDWLAGLLVLVVIVVMLRSYLRTPEGQYSLSSLALRLPIVRQLFMKVYLARLTSILHTLFSSDVPVIESLQLAQSSLGNKVYQNILETTVRAIKDGATISSVWEHEPYIPPMLTTMMNIGERSGEMANALQEAYHFFRRDVDEMLDSITVFVEPLLMIILGVGVGVVVAAVLLPIYNLVLVL